MNERRQWWSGRWRDDDALYAVSTGRLVKDPANAARAVAEARKIRRASLLAFLSGLLLVIGWMLDGIPPIGMVLGALMAVVGGMELVQSSQAMRLNAELLTQEEP